ncbi:phage protein NinX family protein [Enterobacter cloacae]|uniref:phage protein NinX family protein n=1 Tax=Enterobacter cloacae TaxID=550 RepID=UPI003D21855E
MDYSQLSDQEINMLVAKIQHPDKTFIESKTRPPSVVLLNHINMWIDYCNNPADAWPIIQANGICIGYDGISWDASCHLHDIGQINDWKNHPEKPLRMAMIVYLLIQESKHA